MAKSLAQLNAEIASLFPDNTSGLITPASERQMLTDVVASAIGVPPAINLALSTPSILPDGTDQSANMTALLASLQTLGQGATLLFGPGTYRFNSPIVFPNDGVGIPHQVAIVLQGAGSQWSGETGAYPGQATMLDIRTSDALGHIQTYGIGSLTIRDMTITDGGSSGGNPFLFTTNTTLHVTHCTFLGQTGFNGTTNNQDAIVLGGTNPVNDGSTNAAFQGYGTVISENQFDRIRRLAYVRVYANGVVIEKNWVERNSGNPLANGSVIEIDGTGAGGAPGNFAVGTCVRDNVIEISNYPYFVNNLWGANTNITGNSLFDPTATTVAGVLESVNSVDTYVVGNLLTGKPYVTGHITGITYFSPATSGVPSNLPAGVLGPLNITGNFIATGQTCQVGTAGLTNNLQFPQTSGIAKVSVDGVDLIFGNTASGSMFFDNSGSGGKFIFRTTGFATVLDYGNANAGKWTLAAPIVVKSYTVATLPTGVLGAQAQVSDGDAGLAWGATVINSGAGATKYLVWYNGANWTVVGK